MLVLSRKNRERVIIGENVWVKVLRVESDAVTIEVTAPGFTIRHFRAAADGEPSDAAQPDCQAREVLTVAATVNDLLTIGDNYEVMLVDIRGDKARLGFTAPREIPVHREEVYMEIVAEQTRDRLFKLARGDAPQALG